MEPEEIIQVFLDYYQTDTVAAVSITIIVLFLLLKKPKLLFILIILLAAGYWVLVLFAKLSATGLEHRKIPFAD